MPLTIYVEIPDVILERYPSLAKLERSIYEDIIISEFQKAHLTIRESAKLLDLTYEGFMELLGERNLSFMNASQVELKQSYEDFEQFLQTFSPMIIISNLSPLIALGRINRFDIINTLLCQIIKEDFAVTRL